MKRYFAGEDINTGRQLNVDYAKGLAICSMILIHIMIYPVYKNLDSGIGYVIGYIFGGFLAAPVFMTSMGFSLVYTQNRDPKAIIVRGLKILLMAYVLNVVRSIYFFIHTLVSGENVVEDLLYYFLNGDILLFAGLALILFGALKLIKKHSDLIILIVGIVLLIVSTVFMIRTNENFALALTLGILIPVDYFGEPMVCFQLCSWFFFVSAGNILGIMVRKSKNLDRFYTVCGISGVLIAALFLVLDYLCGWEQYFGAIALRDPEYYVGIVYALIAFGLVLAEFALFHFICKFTSEKFNKIVTTFSSALNETYIISWIIILNITYPLILLFAGEEPDLWVYLVGFLFTFPLSVYLGLLWKNLKIRRKKSRKAENGSAA